MICSVSRQTKPWGESDPKYPFLVRHRVVYAAFEWLTAHEERVRVEYRVALYKGAFRMPWETNGCDPLCARRYAGWRQNTGKILLQFVYMLRRHNLPRELSKMIVDLALEDNYEGPDTEFDEVFDFEYGYPLYRNPRLAFKE